MKIAELKNVPLKMELVSREILLSDDVAGTIEMLACIAGDSLATGEYETAAACIEECRLLAAELAAELAAK